MPVNKKQLKRLIRFVAMLKENRYPNCSSFARELRKEDLHNNVNISCTPKTIQRDIKTLREEFDAPIEYDTEMQGYYLLHHGWDFPCPLFEEHEMLASVIGARISEDILPEPLRSEVRQAVDFQLTTNNPDFLDTAFVKSLIISSGLRVNIDPEVFMTLFEAWKSHFELEIIYSDITDKQTERLIEPHALVFRDSAWFVKAYCCLRQGPRTFAVHRIVAAEIKEGNFSPDMDIISSVEEGGLFTYDCFDNIEILCQGAILNFLKEKPLHKEQQIERHSDDTFTLKIPKMAKHEAVQMILYQVGDAKAVAPKELVEQVGQIAEKISRNHKWR